MAGKKAEADAAIQLMRVTYARSFAEEEAKGGLVINSAKYGRFIVDAESAAAQNINSASYIASDEIIDITIPLQILVKDSKLVLQEKSKVKTSRFLVFAFIFWSTYVFKKIFYNFVIQCQLPGFYDPAPGDDKSLIVQYTFQNKPHEVTIRDDEPLRIPKECKSQTQILK